MVANSVGDKPVVGREAFSTTKQPIEVKTGPGVKSASLGGPNVGQLPAEPLYKKAPRGSARPEITQQKIKFTVQGLQDIERAADKVARAKTIEEKSQAKVELYGTILVVLSKNFKDFDPNGDNITDDRLGLFQEVLVQRIYSNEGGDGHEHPKAVAVARAFGDYRQRAVTLKLLAGKAYPNELSEGIRNAAVWVCPQQDEIDGATKSPNNAEDVIRNVKNRYAIAKAVLVGDLEAEAQLKAQVDKRMNELKNIIPNYDPALLTG